MEPASPESRCAACGAVVAGGRAGCQALWDEMMAQGMSDIRYARAYRLAFDAYCMQHPETYCMSVKSYIAHLAGLCCGIEHGGNHMAYAAIPTWINGSVSIVKPELLAERGKMTVRDLKTARSPEQHARLVREWAESVWMAYAAQHALARTWLDTAVRHARGEAPSPPPPR